MFKQFTMELAGRTLRVDIGRVCAQANGAALMHYGDTVVLSTATASKEPREGIDFFPLSVEYEEKMYAVGKIPGGFNKREDQSAKEETKKEEPASSSEQEKEEAASSTAVQEKQMVANSAAVLFQHPDAIHL